MTAVSRRAFVASSTAALVVPLSATRTATASMLRRMEGGVPDSFPSHDPAIVRAVVGKAHVDYDAVAELITPRPELAKSALDWGFGDWESALGAASHMGRRDIAELLIAHGARPNLFTFAMLGQVDVVRATCTANPGIQKLPGPHGITLLHHARQGREQAEDVVAYLEELGDADIGQTSLPLDEKAAQVYVGDYRPGAAPDSVFHIKFRERSKVLTFQRDEKPMRFLKYQGDHLFNASGGASVGITFEVNDGTATRLTIRDGGLEITAVRLG